MTTHFSRGAADRISPLPISPWERGEGGLGYWALPITLRKSVGGGWGGERSLEGQGKGQEMVGFVFLVWGRLKEGSEGQKVRS